MKALLLLGGSRQQVVAIEAARECGFRTVLCDYLSDNPGRDYADVFYQVSTTDCDAVLEVALSEQVDGVIAYSSDPASPTAAYVAEKMGLPTNPLRAVEVMSEKHLFREHLREHGLSHPKAVAIKSEVDSGEIWRQLELLSKPIVLKPTDSSGSKGVTIVRDAAQVADAFNRARKHSRNGVLIAEEFIERVFPYVIGGDIFVVDGQVRFWGLMYCLRDDKCPLLPVGEVTPPGLSPSQWGAVQAALQRLVESLDVRFGELNVEVMLGKDDVPYVIELGSRAGGNMIPVQLSDASGVDLVKANVLCAMGEDPGCLDWEPGNAFYATYVLHSNEKGIYDGLDFSPQATKYLYRKVLYKELGDSVEKFDGANKAIGILFFKFGFEEEMKEFLVTIENHVRVLVGRPE